MKYWIIVHDYINFVEHPDLIGITAKKNIEANEFIRKKDGSYIPRFKQYKGVIIDPKIGDKIAYYCPKDYKTIIGLFDIIDGPNKFIEDWETPIQFKIREIEPINPDNYIPYFEMTEKLAFFTDESTGTQFTGQSAANKIHGPIKPINYKDFNWIYQRYTGKKDDFPKPSDSDIIKSQRRLDNLRIKQAEFESIKQDILKEYKVLEKLRKEFIRKFPIENTKKMFSKNYAIGFGPGNESFCYWLEIKLLPLGNMKGGGTAGGKFGMYYHKKTKEYIALKKYRKGKSVEEAFENIKQEIYDLLLAGKEEDIDAIKNNEISPMFKGKILSTYYPEFYLNVFSEPHLEHFLDKLEINYDESFNEIDKRMKLMEIKNNDEIMKYWNNYLFMKFLYHSYNQPTPAKFAPKELSEYIDNKDDYPKINQVKIECIDLTIIQRDSKPSKRQMNKRDKIEFERENKNKHYLGKQGELIVQKLEKEFLKNNNLMNLVEKVKQVSLDNDSLGYDILSFDEQGNEKYIEVKSTTKSPSNEVNFFISSNQLKVAEKTDNYYFYVVFNAKTKTPKIWRIKNPIKYLKNGLTLTPIKYRVNINVLRD